ncbi:DMT family transporter [Dactylosporangium sp. NPDC049525]|uniref:DMT family transporter n=1 Tax=Dactylosporangium sp. NPDC049525 TaxID=3154730 RepID=UPI003420FF6E
MLVVAVPCAVLAACAYGAATAVEHRAAHADPAGHGLRRVLRLARDRRWLAGLSLDVVAVAFHVTALATGPVVLVQPCLVLALPVSLIVAWRLGGHPPTAAQLRACAWIIAGLAAFFVVIGDPGDADPLGAGHVLAAGIAVAALAAAALTAAAGRRPRTTATVYGLVAGVCAALAAVLLDAVGAAWHEQAARALLHPDVLIAVAVLVPAAIAGVALLQVAFEHDGIGVGYPADLTANPVTAVALGAVLLHEDIPHSMQDLALFILCLAVIVAGAFRLTRGA